MMFRLSSVVKQHPLITFCEHLCVYPRWAPVLLIVSIPVTMFLDPTAGSFQESIGQIMLGIGLAVLGYYALRKEPSSAS